MTNANTLADRVEGAEGPDRALDAEIFIAAVYPDYRIQTDCGDWPEQVQPGRIQEPKGCGWRNAPAYTASLDASMTLVPENDEFRAVFWQIGNDGAGGNPADYLCRILVCSHMASKEYRSTAATPALALAAAALRASNGSNTDG